MDDIEASFLEAIKNSPRDFATRKVYADFLEDRDQIEEADEQRTWDDAKQDLVEAEEWFEKFGRKWGVPVERLIDAGKKYYEYMLEDEWDRGSLFFSSCDNDEVSVQMAKPSVRETYWKHWRVITKIPVPPEHRGGSIVFSCSCGDPLPDQTVEDGPYDEYYDYFD